MLRTILSPEGYPSIQIQALRKELARRLILDAEKQDELDELQNLKNSLLQLRNSPDKRNIEALARGGYIRTQPPEANDPDGLKRSNIPIIEEIDGISEEKRGIQSLARNGDFKKRQREADEMTDEDIRNLEGLVRTYKYSDVYPYPSVYKRNVASLAREGMRVSGKREDGNKRNIGSIKAQYKPTRNKRQIDYYDTVTDEYPSSPQQNAYDYEELMKELTGSYLMPEKRFLGEYF